jgi:hypothetical protein
MKDPPNPKVSGAAGVKIYGEATSGRLSPASRSSHPTTCLGPGSRSISSRNRAAFCQKPGFCKTSRVAFRNASGVRSSGDTTVATPSYSQRWALSG